MSRSVITEYDTHYNAQYDEFKKQFVGDEQTKMYAQFRPTFPEKVYKTISDFCGQGKGVESNDCAVDIGCGPGNSSLPLTKYFSKVMGVDVSEQQIAKAPSNIPGLSFHVSEGEDLSFIQSGSVSLVTVAQALHWIEVDRFYKEVDRILKPGGCLVAYSYNYSKRGVSHQTIGDYIMHVYYEVLGTYWAAGQKYLQNEYKTLPQPYGGWKRNRDFVIEMDWTLDHLLGFVNSWSALQRYNKVHPDNDLMGEIRQQLDNLSMCDSDHTPNKTYRVTWPIILLMARKPQI